MSHKHRHIITISYYMPMVIKDLIFFKTLFEQIGGSVEVILCNHMIPKHFFICQSVTYYHISRLLKQVSAG